MRPERPHGEKASPKWLAGSPDRTDPIHNQTPAWSQTASTVRQPVGAKTGGDHDVSPTAAGGGAHRSPLSDAKPLPGSGAAVLGSAGRHSD